MISTLTLGDAHLYLNHIEQARALPVMCLQPARTSLFDFKYSDFELEGYDPYPAIKTPVAI